MHQLAIFFTMLPVAVGFAQAQPSQVQQSREENLKRIMSATTGATAASVPTYSSTYPQRLRDAIRSNLVPSEPIDGNPMAEVEVRTKPDGVISSFALKRSSGNSTWDAAVLQAVEKTGRIPLDISGAVPAVLVIAFRPK